MLLFLCVLLLTLPEAKDYPEASGIYVFDTTMVRVADDFTQESYRHIKMRIFNTRGRDKLSNMMQRYDDKKDKLELILAYTIKDGGDTIKPADKAIGDLSTVEATIAPTYSHARVKTVAFGGVEPGDLIEYASRKISKPTEKKALFGKVVFGSDEPLLHKVFILETPEEIKYKIKGTVKVETSYNEKSVVYKFECDSIPRVKHENYMLPIEAVGSCVFYTTFNSWEEVGEWLREQFEKSVKKEGNFVKKAYELGSVNEIFRFVSSEWQDILIGFEDIGFTPTPVAEIYKNKYGSPLDKCALLVAMLRSIGKKAYPAYLATKYLEKDIPAPFYFDRIVVAIPCEDRYGFLDPVFPDRFYHRVGVRAILFGEVEEYPLIYDRGYGECLILKEDTVVFYPMPETVSESSVEVSLVLSDRVIKGKIKGVLRGVDAAYARMSLRGKQEKELKQVFEGYADQIKPGTKLISWDILGMDDLLSPVELEMEFETDEYLVKQMDEYRFSLLPNVFSFAPRSEYFGYEERKYPFTTLSPNSMEFTMNLCIPPELKVSYLPENFAYESELGIGSFEIEHEGCKITSKSIWKFKKGIYQSEDYTLLNEMYKGFGKRRFIIFK